MADQSVMDTFKKVISVEGRHDYAKKWKAKTGGKVVGWLCTYVPEEILIAANTLPVRILGSHEPNDVVEPHIFGMFCPFCRDCLAQALTGKYDYLDGITEAHSCMHLRQTYGSWVLHVPTQYQFYLSMPAKVQSTFAKDFLVGELKDFKASLEKWLGKTITDSDLDRGIEVMNRNRRLMRQVYELRKGENPPLTGTEAMQMVVAGQFMDKEEHSRLLERFLKEEAPNRNAGRDTGIRLMSIGGEDDDWEFLEMTEALGATIVIDEHCTGSRYFWNDVVPGKDRLAAIAARYVERPPCPAKDWEKRTRWPHIAKLAQDWNVQGVLLIQQKFCDPHEFDIPTIKRKLQEELNIPSIFLEFEVTVAVGQFRTRVEAFLEMLQLAIV